MFCQLLSSVYRYNRLHPATTATTLATTTSNTTSAATTTTTIQSTSPYRRASVLRCALTGSFLFRACRFPLFSLLAFALPLPSPCGLPFCIFLLRLFISASGFSSRGLCFCGDTFPFLVHFHADFVFCLLLVAFASGFLPHAYVWFAGADAAKDCAGAGEQAVGDRRRRGPVLLKLPAVRSRNSCGKLAVISRMTRVCTTPLSRNYWSISRSHLLCV